MRSATPSNDPAPVRHDAAGDRLTQVVATLPAAVLRRLVGELAALAPPGGRPGSPGAWHVTCPQARRSGTEER